MGSIVNVAPSAAEEASVAAAEEAMLDEVAAAAEEAAAERAHFKRVCAALRGYSASCEPELLRRAAAAAALPPSLAALLPPGTFADRIAATRAAVAANQRVLDWILHEGGDDGGLAGQVLGGGGGGDDDDGDGDGDCSGSSGSGPVGVSPVQASKVRSVLVQIAREWSAEGAAERAASNGVALRLLASHVPRAPANTQRVLLPGCGLGRLVLEVAAGGWVALGVDVGYGMLLAGQAILNSGAAPGSRVVHPWAMQASNVLAARDAARGVAFPDVAPPAALAGNPGARMSIAAGDWAEIFSAREHRGAFAGVVTSYALDTASNPLETVALVAHVLRDGGVWVNVGPLQWHWASASADDDNEGGGCDARYVRSLELTWEEVLLATQRAGFEVLEEGPCDAAPYCSDARSMSATVYRGRYFAARRGGA